MYSPVSSHEKPNPQSMLALIPVRINGSNIGKAKMAVKVELLLVLEAMAETKVRTDEIPKLPMIKMMEKIPLFSKGLPNKTVKNNQLIKAISSKRIPLKINLERMIA